MSALSIKTPFVSNKEDAQKEEMQNAHIDKLKKRSGSCKRGKVGNGARNKL